MEKKEKRVCLVDTAYTLFLYYLICGLHEEDIFIFSGGIPKPIRNNIKHVYYPHYKPVDYSSLKIIPKTIKRISINTKRTYGIIKLRLFLFFKKRKYSLIFYGHAHTNFSFPFYENEQCYLIEDGLHNYMELKIQTHTPSKLQKFFGLNYRDIQECFGTHENIKKVYLTRNKVPPIIKEKTKVIDIKKLWDNKSESEKNKILEIFNINDLVNNLGDCLIMLLTQCFSEDGFIPIDEEINIYKQLINNQKNRNILIKTHPREKKDYHAIFPEFKVIDTPFPLEIFKCLDIKIDKVITISSTAALNFMDECEIEIYNKKTSSNEINGYIDALNEQIILQRNENRAD